MKLEERIDELEERVNRIAVEVEHIKLASKWICDKCGSRAGKMIEPFAGRKYKCQNPECGYEF